MKLGSVRARSNDLGLYERHADDWWNADSAAFRSLHGVNEHRLRVLRGWIGDELAGRIVVDLGCGGGLLSKPLADAGARVLGCDLSPASLVQAREHVPGVFVNADALRAPLATSCADIVLLADVLEHVENPAAALREAARVLRPGGVAFVNTLNRTHRSRLLAVRVAEGVRLVPRGTHAARLFVRPDELARKAWSVGLILEALQGESLNVLKTLRTWAVSLRPSSDLSVGYSALLRKAVNS
jgi:2-polyprenyl-6-hydroxyphenyl methylase/3-demethylubiquinone-9 3-methyltransferase